MSTHASTEPRWTGLSEVLRMAAPIMLGAVSFAGMDFADKMFVSWLGVDHLAAVGNSALWMYTFAVFFMGLAGCVSTFVSQSFGKTKFENCARFAWQGVYVAIAGGTVAFILWPAAPLLFGAMNHSEEVQRLEVLYFRIRIFSIAFIAWEVALSSFFQGISRPIVPMVVGISANLLNVVLDYILIFGKFGFPAMGIAGAAIATVIAVAFQAGALHLIFLSRAVNETYGSRGGFALDLTKCKDLLRVGWPAGVSSLLDVAGWALFTGFIVGSFGTIALGAHTAAMNFMHFSFMPAMALSAAATAVVGQWIGRGDVDKAKARAYTAVKVGMSFMLVTGGCFALFGETLMRVFSEDPEVIGLGRFLLILAAMFACFDACTIVLIGALRGAGDTRWIMWVLTCGAYLVNLPLAWLFAVPLGFGAGGAWIGATIYVISLSAVVFSRFRSERWRNIHIFSEDVAPDAITEAPVPRNDLPPNAKTANAK